MNVLKNVLIIDDDPILRAISQSYFAALGVEDIHAASDGREALKVISSLSEKIDFILCDLNMPELDGVEFLRHLRDCRYTGPIGIVSGEDQSVIETAKNLAKTYRLNVAGTVQKPLSKSEFDDLIANASKRLVTDSPHQKIDYSDADLKKAIEGGQIIPHYQPKIAVETGAIRGAEALARWQHPRDGLVMPDRFIPQAEQGVLIGPLTKAIIQRSIEDMVRWKKCGISTHMSINITPHVLEDRDLPDRLANQIFDAGLHPGLFTLEVTERTVLQKSALAMEVVARMRLKGFDISIDDFGTGTANIDQLRDFPYSELKIDRSFVSGATQDRFALACLKASAIFARELNMRLVAEGISNEAEWNLVIAEDVDEIQGFLIAKPMPAAEFESWYLRNQGVIDINTIVPVSTGADDENEHISIDALLRRAAG